MIHNTEDLLFKNTYQPSPTVNIIYSSGVVFPCSALKDSILKQTNQRRGGGFESQRKQKNQSNKRKEEGFESQERINLIYRGLRCQQSSAANKLAILLDKD